ncbi:aminoglycoside 3-N-acetyltransferase [Paenibacillus sp. yr247]|uniref:AAC(3) family N-acetyltransferase n=1 Tax=Paenibacillus sp. yr247 TaxID=1761880 RepID=UPI00089225B4|nr:AAC(3) family N-acetyltransferase [Paenibacillus sp. yr247]SDO38007.1 aminoglycoside 3-N-acetyltransferase [Paenibacillus sp. yr247]
MPLALTKQSLVDSFRRLGIHTGTRLVIHSSLRSLGPVEGGAETVLDALLECIGKSGLLMAPTFTYNNDIFDPGATPGRTGMLNEVLRIRRGAVRSHHPTHSVTAIGEDAAKFCEGHHEVPGLGIDSPMDKVAKAGGGILLLGVGHTSNSTVHVGESYAGVPYLDIPFNPRWPSRIPIAGDIQQEVNLTEYPGCSRAFGVIEASLRQRGVIRDGLIGKGLAQWVSGQDVISATMDLLERNAGALLCSDLDCYRCSRGHKRLSASLWKGEEN